jgi:hypothetical protein
MGMINEYYKHLDGVTLEIILYLETCIEVVSEKGLESASTEMFFNVLTISKINKKLHKSDRVKFLCEQFEETVFNVNVKRGEFSVAIKNEEVHQKRPAMIDKEEQLFADSYK